MIPRPDSSRQELAINTSSPAPVPTGPLPYAEITDDSYAERAAQNFTVVEAAPGTLVLHGPCPRCATLIDIPVVQSIFRGFHFPGGWPTARHGTATEPAHNEPMICTCGDEHPGRPEGRQGCGAYWILNISPS
jgi:hypothetical protein